eukprot:scaffold7403_cov277-Pinguiococcus_pyrenoidosus.AAC.15
MVAEAFHDVDPDLLCHIDSRLSALLGPGLVLPLQAAVHTDENQLQRLGPGALLRLEEDSLLRSAPGAWVYRRSLQRRVLH